MQALIIIVLGIPLTMGFGIVGTIAASCVSNAYRVVDLLLFEPTRISRDTVSSSLSAFGLYVLQTALIAIPGYLLSSLACTWVLWAAVAAALVLWGVAVVCLTLALLDKDGFRSIFKRFVRNR